MVNVDVWVLDLWLLVIVWLWLLVVVGLWLIGLEIFLCFWLLLLFVLLEFRDFLEVWDKRRLVYFMRFFKLIKIYENECINFKWFCKLF